MEMINNVIHSDVFEYLMKVEDNSVDLILTDPPYGIGIDDWDIFENEEEYFNFIYSFIELSLPKLKENGSLYLFNNAYNSAYVLQFLVKKGLLFQNWITWYKKDGFTSLKKRYNRTQETCLFFSKTKNYTFNYDDIRIPYESKSRIEAAKTKGILKNGKRWFPNENGKLCNDVWEFSSEKNRNKVNGKIVKQFHSTQKPLEMIKRIIIASSNKGDLILDPFMGSGTTAIACKSLGRNFLGCDSNLEYVEYANNILTKIE
jgi:site-specific DNA-methyltransferase (adenine-specific)